MLNPIDTSKTFAHLYCRSILAEDEEEIIFEQSYAGI